MTYLRYKRKKKKAIIIGISTLAIATAGIIAGFEYYITSDYYVPTTSYTDSDEEISFRPEIKYIDNEDEVINLKAIKSGWFISKVKYDDETMDIVMLRMACAPDEMPNGDVTYYYMDEFSNKQKIYSSTYFEDDSTLIKNSGPNILEIVNLSDVLADYDMLKDNYTRKELLNFLNDVKKDYEDKKLSDENALTKVYYH